MYRAGIDIGGTKINIGLVDEQNNLTANKKIYVKDIINFAETVKSVLEELCEANNISYGEILSCGIGVPGTVSEDGKRLIKAPNISILSENIAFEMEELLNIPVAMVQDSRAAAWAEYVCGAGKGSNTVVCISIGTGLGTGIVLNGKIYNGALGNAGEIGHIPVCENGRECGCGKYGCLEKYCAGGGLDITARELYGEGKTAEDLFENALSGDEKAREEIEKAVKVLGSALVGVINLLSPDCLLFSGGLSNREEEYINPVINYIKRHCYTAGKLPELKKAELGDMAPLIGAALVPEVKRRKPLLSASVMCADLLNLGDALKEIESAGIDYIHADIMDNHFVPNLMLPTELLNKLHENTKLPFDYHIMAEKPESIIDKLTVREGDIICVHYESTSHLQMVLTKIKEKGAKAAVALNPSTPVSVLEEVIPELDMVLVMTVNPGFAGQKIVPGAFDKIRRMRKMFDNMGYSYIPIEVDGNCSFENVPKMYKAGAEIFVVGTSSVFKKDMTIKEGTDKLLKEIR